jgi:hypothetical protein
VALILQCTLPREAWSRAVAWMPDAPRRQLLPGIVALLFRAGHEKRACEVAVAINREGIGTSAWEKQATNVTHYSRYRPIFHALGLRNDAWDVLCDREEKARREAEGLKATKPPVPGPASPACKTGTYWPNL